MRLLFLMTTSIILIMTAAAKPYTYRFACRIDHKINSTSFYLMPDKKKEVYVGDWLTVASITSHNNDYIISLARIIKVMDATYQKVERKKFNKQTKNLSVELIHTFGGKDDLFTMICVPAK